MARARRRRPIRDAMAELENAGAESAATARAFRLLAERAANGIEIEGSLIRDPKGGTFADFFLGKIDEVPIKARFKIDL